MSVSPMMGHYLTLKEKYNDSLLFFRLGDFYEMFFDDAKTASRELGLTLTGRDCGMEERAPMCGVPYHAVDGYVSKLIAKGYNVAICEQLTAPGTSKDMLERDVVRVITPGTVIEEGILDEKKNNYIACVNISGADFAVAWLDISTGEFNVSQSAYSDFTAIEEVLVTVAPAEIISSEKAYEAAKDLPSVRLGRIPALRKYQEWAFSYAAAKETLCKQFEVATLAKFEFENKKTAVGCAGALINYVLENSKRALSYINDIKYVQSGKFLIIDSNTRKNLELVETINDTSHKSSLLYVLDKTKTNMGARNLRRWLEQPLRDSVAINDRLDAVEELTNNVRLRSNLDEALKEIRDIERLITKIVYGAPSPRDMLSLRQSLLPLPAIKELIGICASRMLKKIDDAIFTLDDVSDLLNKSIADDPPSLMKDGGYIRDGYSEKLDEYRLAKNDGTRWLAELETKEKEETGIKNLKIGFNRVFGYYIEVSNSNKDRVPFRYVRKQTLTTGERFITEELKQIENKLLGAEEKAVLLEAELFEKVRRQVVARVAELQSTAKNIAYLDTLLSFAEVSTANGYTRPTIDDAVDCIEIKDGRHPVVEALLKRNEFVPNDTKLDCCQNRMMIITGPNMSGKSTYMRQVALITIMAHMGCFVSAASAKISITDRIFTRIGASDDVAYGRSTFMVEMVEVATILQNATFKSLLILDEVGRGTSTFDGLSIAQAVTEDICNRIRCKTMFSTHYHELTDLEHTLEGVRNFKIIAAERNHGIVFLHKIMRGGTNKSFGIEVAKLAGVPTKVISRAKEISHILEQNPINVYQKRDEEDLISICSENGIKDDLVKCNVDSMSPLEALIKLGELVERAKGERL